MSAYYNEHDPFAAAWLRELIKAGHIASGDVDERSIEDVCPDDLRGYVQCHFFAGIGVWSHALRMAGWEDNRAIWTGSCPCQPFSAAGKGAGFDDERHLWPAFFDLIGQCAPAIVIGEQVASKDGLAWLDLVRADVEGAGRAFAAADLCAAGFGAPHIRQRSFWVAYDGRAHGERRTDTGRPVELGAAQRRESAIHAEPRGGVGRLPSAARNGCGEVRPDGGRLGSRDSEKGRAAGSVSGCPSRGLDYADSTRHVRSLGDAEGNPRHEARLRLPRAGCEESGLDHSIGIGRGAVGDDCASDDGAPPTNGFWTDADWLGCRDGKWRPVEPGTFPLAHGATNRVGRLRGYGNAIVAPVAQGFIGAVMAASPRDPGGTAGGEG